MSFLIKKNKITEEQIKQGNAKVKNMEKIFEGKKVKRGQFGLELLSFSIFVLLNILGSCVEMNS